jgi:hypothetical protein
MTIGYIAQEIQPGNLTTDEVDNILSALISNLELSLEKEIVNLAITALVNFVVFATKNMQVENDRAVILNTIYQVLTHTDEDIRVLAMQTLVEISRVFYEQIQDQMEKLIQTTCTHVSVMFNY